MLAALRARAGAVVLVLSAGALAFGAPAAAIQTSTWGIQPGPHGNARTRASLSYPSNGQTVHDSVVIYNRTASPEVINLKVLGAVHAAGGYQYSTVRAGLAAGVSVAADRITLGPHQQAQVPVTLKLPRHSKVTTLAGISAEGAQAKQGALLIQERLVILVKATPSTHAPPIVPDIGLWGPLAAALLAVSIGLVVREARRRRLPVVGTGPLDDETRTASMAGVG